jgi:hypothetical protein
VHPVNFVTIRETACVYASGSTCGYRSHLLDGATRYVVLGVAQSTGAHQFGAAGAFWVVALSSQARYVSDKASSDEQLELFGTRYDGLV